MSYKPVTENDKNVPVTYKCGHTVLEVSPSMADPAGQWKAIYRKTGKPVPFTAHDCWDCLADLPYKATIG